MSLAAGGEMVAGAPLFDVLLSEEKLSPRAGELLADFDVRQALLCASPDSAGPATAGRVLRGFERLLQRRLPALRARGVEAWAALGLLPAALELADVHRALHGLPALLELPAVKALGPVALGLGRPHEADLLRQQARLARELDLALVLQASAEPWDGRGSLARALDLLLEEEVAPERILVWGVDARNVEPAETLGTWIGMELRADPEAQSALVERMGGLPTERIVLGSGVGPAALEPLALPRFADWAARSGALQPAALRAMLWDNARRLLGFA